MNLRQTDAHLVQRYPSSSREQAADTGECYADASAPDDGHSSASVEESLSARVATEVQLDTEHLNLLLKTMKGGMEKIQHIYPLTPLQEGMLFHRLLNQRDSYVLSRLIELPSKALVDPLIAAVQAVIDRHEAFRSAIVWEGLPHAVQVVYRHATLPVQHITLSDNGDVLEGLRQRIRRHEELIDVTRAPLLRLMIAPGSGAGPVYAALQVHHLVCDHHSLRVALSEVVACLDGHWSELPAPAPYTAYLPQAPEKVREAEAFFFAKLGSVEEPSAPFGVLDVRGDGTDSREATLQLNCETSRGIRATCERLAVTPARLFHAAWALVIARTSGSDDVVYGTVLSSGQTQRSQIENRLGLFVNTLPLRVRLEGLTARQLLDESDRELRGLRAHRDASLTVAQRCSGIQEGAPLFTSILNFRHSEADQRAESECGVRLLERDEGWTNYPVVMIVDDLGDVFTLCTQTEVRIDPSRVARYLETALSSLIHALDTTPEVPALSLKVLPADETTQLLEEFNPGCKCSLSGLQLHELFESRVRWAPHAIAVACAETKLTYRDLNERANQLARYLRANGVRSNELVALSLERSVELVVGILAILKAGAAYVPLDPSYPAERVAFMLSDAAPAVVVTHSKVRRGLASGDARVISIDEEWREIARHDTRNLDAEIVGKDLGNLAYVIYTSGSTGKPKGVMVQHANVTRLFAATEKWFHFDERDVWTLYHSFAFDFSVWELWGALLYGGRLVIVPHFTARSPDDFYRLVCEEAVTVLNQTPSAFLRLMSAQGREQTLKHSLRIVVFGGERLDPRVLRPWVERNGVEEPKLINMYGITETTVHVTYCPLGSHEVLSEGGSVIGKPIPDLRVYVLDRHRRPAPIGVVGEMYVGGAGVAQGYLNRPDLTAERFIPDPFSGENRARLYKTGDLARWRADGNLEYLGRNDSQVKIRGYRIELGEVEAEIASFRGVKSVVVVAREDQAGDKRLVAYVIPDGTEQMADARFAWKDEHLGADIRTYLKGRVPEHAIPSAFVSVSAFPLTPNGKLDWRALPVPGLDSHIRRQYEPPQGEMEEILAGIWQELLQVERVGRQDNFFELGGHSLLIVQLMECLRRVGLSADVRRTFEAATLADLAKVLTDEVGEQFEVPANRIPPEAQAITPQMLTLVDLEPEHIERIVQAIPGGAANVQDIYPLAPLQEGILFHHLLGREGADLYARPMLLRLDSGSTLDQLISALQGVINRHDILRTAVLWENLPQPLQVVCRQVTLPVVEIALQGHREPFHQLRERMRSGEVHPLDLRKPPLMRLEVCLRLERHECYALLWTHHLVTDNASLDILLSEVLAHMHGRADSLPEPAPYRDHVAQAIAQAQRCDAEAFFRSKLSDLEEPSAPFGVLNAQEDGSQIEEATERVDEDLAARIRGQARRLGVSAATIFHAALALVIARTCGRDDVVFGTVLLGRLQGNAGARRTLGMFINTLPLRLRLDDIGAEELVYRTQRELIDLLSHEQASLAVAQRSSGLAGSAPLFSVLLNYLHRIPASESDWAGEPAVQLVASEGKTNYAITLSVNDLGTGFSLTAQIDRRIEAPRMITYVTTALQSLMDALDQEPGTPAVELCVLPKAELDQIIDEFNATHAGYPQNTLIHQLFEEQVGRTASKVAATCGGQQMTYAELNARANQLGRYLRSRGVGPDQLVGLCVGRNLNMAVGILGILKAGGAYVPLDPAYPPQRLGQVLEDAAPKVLLTEESLTDRLPRTSAEIITFDGVREAVDRESPDNLEAKAIGLNSRHLAYLIYTSGSTGRPKGVAIEHRNTVNLICWAQYAVDPAVYSRTLHCTSLNFDLAVYEFFVPLATGGSLVIVENALSLMEQPADVTLINTVPSAMAAILDAGAIPETVRAVNLAGEALKKDLVDRLFASSGVERVSNLYGPSETTTYSTWISMHRRRGFVDSIGRPVANTKIYILDGHLQSVPIGVVGEIYIGGAGVARGYLNRPELTDERFLTDTYSSEPNARMYKTGDLGRWRPDGTIQYLGRNDHQVKIRGFRIELGEIEARLVQHPQVKEAVVIAREDVPGGKYLVAYVIAREPEVGPGVERLRAHLGALLPEHMVPSAFVVLERLPLTPNGKVDRRALPAPGLESYIRRQYEAPQGEVEEILAATWQELLHVERIGRHDNFFELGGHSLLIVQMMERLRRVGLSTDIRRAFDTATLADLAKLLTDDATEQFEVPANRIAPDAKRITPEMLALVNLEPGHIECIVQAVSGGAANVQDIYPLAPLQEGILFHHLMNPGGQDPYLTSTLLSVASRERLDQLIAALQAVIDRHDILRTAVLWEQLPNPMQIVYRRAPLPLEEVQLDPLRDVRRQALDWLRTGRQRMDLRRAPLLRLVTAADPHSAQCYAMLQMHHIVGDNTSREILLSEILTCLKGGDAPLPPPVPYRSHVAQALAHAKSRDAEGFFRRKFSDIDEPTAPFGVSDVYGDGSRVQEAHEILSLDLSHRIRASARSLGVSSATLFHAAWSLVVASTSGRDDVVFGTVLLGRLHSNSGAQTTLGMFINTLPIRMQLHHVSAKGLVEQTQRELVELLGHEQATLATAQRCSALSGSTPMFSALLNYRHSAQQPETEWDSAAGISVVAVQSRTNYPIVLSVDDLGDGFTLTAQTDERITAARVAAYMSTALRALVHALESSPKTAAMLLPVLTESERRQLLESFNPVETAYPQERLVHELFEEQVRRSPETLAVTFEEKSLSYVELNRRANRLARYLRGQGVGPDKLVAICVERSLEMVVGLLATLKAGGAYLPLDPNYPRDRLEFMMRDAAPDVVLTQEALWSVLPAIGAPVILLDTQLVSSSDGSDENLCSAEVGITPENLLYVIYTSGSTGRPKGTAMPHRALVNLISWHGRTFGSGEPVRVLQFAALSFDVAFQEVFSTLCTGGSLVLLAEWVRKDVRALMRLLSEQRVERLFLPPLMLQALAEYAKSAGAPPLGSLQDVIAAGEQLRISPEIQSLFESLKGCRLHNHYGPTETHVVTSLALAGAPGGWPLLPSIGRPVSNSRIYILDRHRQLAPRGVPGEIYIGGIAVARGYLGRPELTAERFVSDPFSPEPEARMYKTGDLGRWEDDGTIVYLGRNDQQVKIRGFRVELGEIESQLARHPQVKEAAVVARQDARGSRYLVAYVIPRESGLVNRAELECYLKDSVPEHMVPSAFVVLQRLPLTPSGKLDRRALPEPEGLLETARAIEPPLGATEEALARIWQEVLGRERIGRGDNFFELGGHSLSGMRAAFKIEESLGVSIPVPALFKYPTVQLMAAAIASDAFRGPAPTLGPPPSRQELRQAPVTFSQLLHWNLNRLWERPSVRQVAAAVRLRGRLDIEALHDALTRTAKRHSALRTYVSVEDGTPLQNILAESNCALDITDLTGAPLAVREEKLRALVEEYIVRPIDVSRAPLFGVALFKVREQEHVLLLAMEHLVSDAFSLDLLMRELLTTYCALLNNDVPIQTQPTVQLSDYAAWQNRTINAWLAEHEPYWRARLSDVENVRIPVATQRKSSAEWGTITLLVDRTLKDALNKLARSSGTTLVMCMFAAYVALIAHSSRREEAFLQFQINGRPRPELEESIGFFASVLYLRVPVCKEATFLSLLKSVVDEYYRTAAHSDSYYMASRTPRPEIARTSIFNWVPQGAPIDLSALQDSPLALECEPFPVSNKAVQRFQWDNDPMTVLFDGENQIAMAIHFPRERFSTEEMERFADRYSSLLTAMAHDAACQLGSVAFWDEPT